MREAPPSVRDARRAEIVAAARRIVAERGLDALTFAALERALGYTRGVVTWHFRNKDEVVRAVLEDAIAEVDAVALAAIRSEETLADRARAVVRVMVRGWIGGSQVGRVLVPFWGRIYADPVAREANAAMLARYRDYSAELVRIGQRRGEFRGDADPAAAGAVIVALVVGIAAQAMFDPALDAEPAVAAAGDAVVAWLVAG
ncbi:MAG: helix-turn-helix domain-containing protein [Myxococcota bacterium]